MLNLTFHKNRLRVGVAAGLLVLFTFTSLFAVYQNGNDLTAAYASSSGNNQVGVFKCAAAILACLSAMASAIAKCSENVKAVACAQAVARAMLACSEVPGDCDFIMPGWPQFMVDAGLV